MLDLYLAKITKTNNGISIDSKTNKEYLLEVLSKSESDCNDVSELNLTILKKCYNFFDFSECTMIPTKAEIRSAVESVTSETEIGKLNYLNPEFAANDLTLIDPKYWERSKELSSNTSPFLTLLGGPMGAGKTTELIRRVKYYRGIGKNVVCLKSIIDNRYDTPGEVYIKTHDMKKIPALHIREILDQIGYILSADVVVIDELQFYITVKNIVFNLMKINKTIIFTGLVSTHDLDPLLSATLILPYATEVVILNSSCTFCENKAYYISTKKDKFYSSSMSSGITDWDVCCFKHHYNGLSRLEN
ncbi:thymidine kinase [Carp edema virus]|nr:thymidine kinase [Carp edema virus]